MAYLRSNADFRELLSSAGSMSECLSLAKDQGFNVTGDMIRAALRVPLDSDDLSDDELGPTSGGFSGLDW